MFLFVFSDLFCLFRLTTQLICCIWFILFGFSSYFQFLGEDNLSASLPAVFSVEQTFELLRDLDSFSPTGFRVFKFANGKTAGYQIKYGHEEAIFLPVFNSLSIISYTDKEGNDFTNTSPNSTSVLRHCANVLLGEFYLSVIADSDGETDFDYFGVETNLKSLLGGKDEAEFKDG